MKGVVNRNDGWMLIGDVVGGLIISMLSTGAPVKSPMH